MLLILGGLISWIFACVRRGRFLLISRNLKWLFQFGEHETRNFAQAKIQEIRPPLIPTRAAPSAVGVSPLFFPQVIYIRSAQTIGNIMWSTLYPSLLRLPRVLYILPLCVLVPHHVPVSHTRECCTSSPSLCHAMGKVSDAIGCHRNIP